MNKCPLLFALLCISCATKGQNIVYDFPETVTTKLADHISKGKNSKVVGLLTKEDSGKYSITIIENDFSKNDNLKIIDETLIKKTNHFLRLNKILVPIITNEDLQFADFGTVETPNSGSSKRKIGK